MRIKEGPGGKKILTGEKQERTLSSFMAELAEMQRGLEYSRELIAKNIAKGEKPSRTDLNQLQRYAEQMPRIAEEIRKKAEEAA